MRRIILKRILITLVISLFMISSLAPAQLMLERNKPAYTSNASHLLYTVEVIQEDLIFDTVMDYDVVTLVGEGCRHEIGKPMLPQKTIALALPYGFDVQDVYIATAQQQVLSGDYMIFPAQAPRRTDGLDDTTEFVEPDLLTYSLKQLYPSSILEDVYQTDLAGQTMVTITLNPVQYLPSEKKLIFTESVVLDIVGNDGYRCSHYLPRSISEYGRQRYQSMVESLVINPADVVLHHDPEDPVPTSLPDGQYDEVIIVYDSYASYWQTLADWRTKSGHPTNIVTRTYIYNNYAGDNQQKIRSFIIDANTNWGTLYFLIAGEGTGTYAIPFEERNYVSEDIPSDQYYGDFNDNWVYDVYVGRVTAEGSTQINCFVNKILKYEKDPPATNYALDATLLGMDLSIWPDPVTSGETLKNYIDVYYIPSRFDVTTIYDDDSGYHDTAFINALNDGQNLVNHCDHSNWWVMGTGDRNHGWYIDIDDVNGLSNNYRMSVIYSIGCNDLEMDTPGDYHWYDCIGEYFVI